MSQKLQFTLKFDEDLEDALQKTARGYQDYRILSKSLDARGANRGKPPTYHYTVEVVKEGERFSQHEEEFPKLEPFEDMPIIVGAGPGGLFCALRLAEYGIPSIIVERGERAHNRMKHIARHWRYGEFDPDNNVCFGEGGAGLFSDGKLITRVKSPHVKYVMQKFVDFGAPPETAYLSNPHLGSNKIRLLINKISDFLISKGCQVHYNAAVEEILTEEGKVRGVKLRDGRVLESDKVILATGHSADSIYRECFKKGVAMAHKDFAVGVRIEHPREHIDKIQYGAYAGDLGAARYRISHYNPETKRGTYSFCMCPGGYVLSSGTDEDGIVVNGMSNYARNSRWSNAALVVTVRAGIDFEAKSILSGMDFQRSIEHKAYELSLSKRSGKEIPAQTLSSFVAGKLDKTLPKTSTPSGIFESRIEEFFPNFVKNHLIEALESFNKKLPGFVGKEALLLAPETRTSAPITILRDKETLESTSHQGLYPCGEGAGHAGGITSAAVDGVKIAMSLLKEKLQ